MLASFWGIKLSSEDICLVISKDIAAATLKRLSMFVMRAKLTLADATAMLPELFAQHDLAAWSEGEVARGVTRITAPLVDLFVPQMLNYESIGGVSFKKGCYPGQEIVARSQFRGAIKRRTYLVQTTSSMVGLDVFAFGENESVGVVVQTENNQALICIQTSRAGADLRLGTKDGLALTMRDLPYPLLEDI
jgi:folate-binding protein YgfZ